VSSVTGEESRGDIQLVESAHLMRTLAEKLCRGSYLDRDGCSWYHSAWQYLRMLDMVSTPDWHERFYTRAISEAWKYSTHTKAYNVLVCGLADYAMLAHVVRVLRNLDASALITVFDICETPLRICQWWADKHGASICACKGDALALNFRHSVFDLIVTDSFLTRFSPESKNLVTKQWLRVLRSGGMVVTTVRLGTRRIASPSRNDVHDFELRARTLASKSKIPDSVAIDMIARTYASRIVSYPVDEREISDIFAGFKISSERVTTKGEFAPTEYLQIVAKKSPMLSCTCCHSQQRPSSRALTEEIFLGASPTIIER